MAVGAVLKGGAGAGERRSTGRRTLVVVQVAASLVLLASAAVIYGATRHALRMDFGFEPRGLSMADVNPHDAGYDRAQQAGFYGRLLVRRSPTLPWRWPV